jgi:hypothetical protein
MPIRLRKLVGAILLIALVVTWALLARALAQSAVVKANGLIEVILRGRRARLGVAGNAAHSLDVTAGRLLGRRGAFQFDSGQHHHLRCNGRGEQMICAPKGPPRSRGTHNFSREPGSNVVCPFGAYLTMSITESTQKAK